MFVFSVKAGVACALACLLASPLRLCRVKAAKVMCKLVAVKSSLVGRSFDRYALPLVPCTWATTKNEVVENTRVF